MGGVHCASVDGDTAAEGLAEHLAGCVECSQLLEDLRTDQQQLQRTPEIGPAVCDAVRKESVTARRSPKARLGPWAAAVAALLIAGIWLRPKVPRSSQSL